MRLPAPRWQTPLPPGVVGSWGPLVGAYAQGIMGVPLDRWQQRGINRALAYDAGFHLVHRHYLVSCARQQGKTVLVRALIGAALTEPVFAPWSLILGVAHDRAQARIPYEAVLGDLLPARARLAARGGLALTRYLGIRSDLYGRHREYHTASREAANSIRSMSVDLGLFDEVRTQRTFDTWSALEPTTRARPDPLILGISTAGDDRSVLLRSWWERGIRVINGAEPAHGFGMTWYAADDTDDPASDRAILKANPAVAEGRVPIGPVRASRVSLTEAAYRQETLNLWSSGGDEWLPAGVWQLRIGRQPELAGQRVVLGVEAVPTWRRATVLVAVETDAGAWLGIAGELDAPGGSVRPDALGELVTRLAREWQATAVAYSATAAAAPYVEAAAKLIPGLEAIALGPRQVKAASELLRSELVGGRLTHADDPLMAAQVAAARPSGPLEGGDWYLSVRESAGEVDAIRAAAWAAWTAIAPEARKVKPQVF